MWREGKATRILLWAFCVVTWLRYSVGLAYCDVPSPSKSFEAAAGVCVREGGVALSLDDAAQIAWKYAPVLYFHPDEKYFPQSVDDFIAAHGSKGKVYSRHNVDAEEREFGPLNEEVLFETTTREYFLNGKSYYYAFRNNDTSWRAGADFVNGVSTAKIYFNVFEHSSNVWVFNYYFFYPFNGCSNQWLLTRTADVLNSRPYYICDMGVHDGEWEGVSVMVCKNQLGEQKPLSVKYDQHKWNLIRDCQKDECTFVEETNHPVSISALFSHATYDQQSFNLVYAPIPIPFIFNLYSMNVVDRPVIGDKRFQPTVTNVVRLPKPEEIVSTSPLSWAVFAGKFGDASGSPRGIFPPVCLSNDTFVEVECDYSDEIFNLVMCFYGVGVNCTAGPNDLLGGFFNLTNSFANSSATNTASPRSPLSRVEFEEWDIGRPAPIWDVFRELGLTEEQGLNYCEELVSNANISVRRYVVPAGEFKLITNAILFVIVAVFVAIVHCVFLSVSPHELNSSFSIDDEIPSSRLVKWFFFYELSWIAVATAGFVTWLVFAGDLFFLLNRDFPIFNWSVVKSIMYIFVCLGYILSFLAVLCGAAQYIFVYRSLYRKSEFTTVQDLVTSKSFMRLAPILVSFTAILLGFSIFNLLSSLLALLYSALVVGLAVAMTPICNDIAGSLGDTCIDFSGLGAREITCGADVQQFCNDWSSLPTAAILWGGIFAFFATVFILSTRSTRFIPIRDFIARLKVLERELLETPSKEPQAAMTSNEANLTQDVPVQAPRDRNGKTENAV